VEQLRFFNEVLKWHADGEDELVFPAIEKVAPLAAKTYVHDHHECDAKTARAWPKSLLPQVGLSQPGRQLH
jgi:hypothetical protein